MRTDLLPVLRKELENSFGRKILSSRDCLQMVEDIYQKTGYTINANTLRRFFGLVKTSYSASPSTLTILSKYCGFNSIDELQNVSTGKATNHQAKPEELVHYMVSLFRNLPVRESFIPVVAPIVHQTVQLLNRNPGVVEKFQREIAGTTAGQYYYFEKSVNMDRLNGYYGDGLRFYMRARNNNEARVFTHAVLVLRHWLSNKYELLEKSMLALSSVPMSINYPPHILARSVAARLFYANYKNEIPDRILADAAKYYSVMQTRYEYIDADFDLVIGEALILTNHIQEGLEMIKRGKSKLQSGQNPPAEQLYAVWEKIGSQKKNPLQVLNNPLKPNRNPVVLSSPLNRKYLTLLLQPGTNRTQRKNMSALVDETGYKRLSS